jgi:hypothetical protein
MPGAHHTFIVLVPDNPQDFTGADGFVPNPQASGGGSGSGNAPHVFAVWDAFPGTLPGGADGPLEPGDAENDAVTSEGLAAPGDSGAEFDTSRLTVEAAEQLTRALASYHETQGASPRNEPSATGDDITFREVTPNNPELSDSDFIRDLILAKEYVDRDLRETQPCYPRMGVFGADCRNSNSYTHTILRLADAKLPEGPDYAVVCGSFGPCTPMVRGGAGQPRHEVPWAPGSEDDIPAGSLRHSVSEGR